MDFKAELERVEKQAEESSRYWKLRIGLNKVKFLSDEVKLYTHPTWSDKPEMADFEIEADGVKKIFSERTKSKLYRKIMKLAVEKGGLAGKTLVIMKSGEGFDTRYEVDLA